MWFVLRWLFAFVLLAATFNPTGWNYVRWSQANVDDSLPLVVLFGLLLIVGYIVYLRATLRSIGPLGMLLVTAVFVALIWVLYDLGWLDLGNSDFLVWLGIVGLSLVLGIGLSWSFIRRALSGQYDVDETDE